MKDAKSWFLEDYSSFTKNQPQIFFVEDENFSWLSKHSPLNSLHLDLSSKLWACSFSCGIWKTPRMRILLELLKIPIVGPLKTQICQHFALMGLLFVCFFFLIYRQHPIIEAIYLGLNNFQVIYVWQWLWGWGVLLCFIFVNRFILVLVITVRT